MDRDAEGEGDGVLVLVVVLAVRSLRKEEPRERERREERRAGGGDEQHEDEEGEAERKGRVSDGMVSSVCVHDLRYPVQYPRLKELVGKGQCNAIHLKVFPTQLSTT